MDSPASGILYIVSTPIGNLGDITLRALDILKEVDLAAAEDTRHSRKLFSRYGIRTRLVSYYGPREEEKGEEILRALREGKRVALISDAGTPGISDPGHYLVRRAALEGITVRTVPGPSALVSALTLSGIPTARFVFEGFLPPRGGERKRRIEALVREERTVVLYESPRRVPRTLKDLEAAMGDREAVLARELTKLHEEVLRGRISDILETVENKGVRGEVTLVIAGADKGGGEPPPVDDQEGLMRTALLECGSVKAAAERLAAEMKLPRRKIYQELLRIKEEGRS